MATLAISVLGTVFIVGFLVYTGEPVPLDPLLFCFRNLSLVSRPHVFDGFGCQLAYSLSKHAEGSTSKWGHPQNSSFMGKLHRKTSAFFSSVFRKENENINTSVQAAQEYPSPVEPKDGDRPKNPMPVVVHRRAVHYLTNTGTAHGKNPENPLSPMQGNAARLTSSARNDSPTYDLAGALKHFDMDAPGTAKGEFKTTKIFSADTRPPPGFIARAMARAASRAAAGGLYRDTSFPNMQSTGRSSSSDSEETVREGKGKETQRDSKDTNVSKGSTATEGFSQTKWFVGGSSRRWDCRDQCLEIALTGY
ncbi:MAG: hypothetical protein M1833_006204 [Piccolia ochrophora]|nr:MAG: hypothetical protein M1833_006204 [Piccolia ochrophora]